MADHELFLGDCLEGLRGMESGSVDVFLSDPPYDEHTHSAQRRGSSTAGRGKQFGLGSAISMDRHLGFGFITEEDMQRVAVEAARITKRWVVIFCAMEQQADWMSAIESAGLEHVRFGIWVKPGSTPQFTGDRPGSGCEAIEIAHRPGKKRWNGGGGFGLWTFPIVKAQGGQRVHPTQKPLELMEALVRDFTDPDELVCDPFAGSGTTGVACKRLGRRFIGWERDPKFHAAAVKRLDAARRQYELTPPRVAPMKQATLIAETRPCEAFDCGAPGPRDPESKAWLCPIHAAVPLSIRKDFHRIHARRRAQSVAVQADAQGDAA